MRQVLFIFLILFTSVFSAQTATAVFQNTNNKTFQVSINHVKQHENYSNNISIKKLTGNRPYNVKINFKHDTVFVQKNIYLVDDGLAHIYNITKKAITLKKIVPAASYSKIENQLTVNYIINNKLPIDTIVKDTIQKKDTSYAVPFETYYKMDNYDGKIGCPWPVKLEEISKLKGVINAQNLEESKLEAAKEQVQEIDSVCFTMDQTIEILTLFEFEETKLDFAMFVASFIFDIDNIGKLTDVFDFENSLEELKKEIGI